MRNRIFGLRRKSQGMVHMNKLVWVLGLTSAIALAAPAQAVTNLVVNGDFSSPSEGGSWSQSDVLGWTNMTEPGMVEVGNSAVYGLACINSACQNLEVNANTQDLVSQDVSGLVVGKQYNLNWEYGGRAGGGVQILDVGVGNGKSVVDTGSYGVWTANWLGFTATNTTEAIYFDSQFTTGLPSYGNEVTNVSVTAAPEASTWAMMVLGFAGLGFAGYRRKAARKALSV